MGVIGMRLQKEYLVQEIKTKQQQQKKKKSKSCDIFF